LTKIGWATFWAIHWPIFTQKHLVTLLAGDRRGRPDKTLVKFKIACQKSKYIDHFWRRKYSIVLRRDWI
jgi:hypothetical protein